MTTKEIQNQIDAKAAQRQYWRDCRTATLAPATAPIISGLKQRIKAKAEEYVSRYDKCPADDSISIARCQEGRLICKEILLEFEEDVCNKTITRLDEEIKALTEQMKKASQGGEEPIGFGNLLQGK